MRATQSGNYANITRNLSTGLGMGDSLTFYWGVNWDTDGGDNNKGFNLRAGDTELFNVNMGGSTAITVNGTGTGFDYGTTAMLVTVTRTATGYSFSMTSKSGSATFNTSITTSATLDTFAAYAGNNNGDINRNIYFNNFTNANSGVFSQGGSVANNNNFSGTGNLSIGNNTTLTIGGTATYSGTTTITNGGLVLANGGNYTFASAVSGAGSLSKNGAGAVTITGNNSGLTGETILNNGSILVGNANAFGTGTMTINFNDGTGTRTLASSSATAYTLNNNFNLFYNAFSLGSAGTGALTLGASTNTFFLGSDGGATTRTITVTGSHTIGAEITGGANNRINVTGGGTLTLSRANTFSGGAEITSGTILVGNNASLGTGNFTFNFNGGAGSRVLASSSSTGYTLNNDFNVIDDAITIGQTSGGTGSLILGGTGKNFNLGDDGEAKFRAITVNGSHTIAGNLTGGANNSIVKRGAGTLTLSGAANTFGGGLFIDSGVVNLSGGALTGSTVLDIGGGVNGNAVNASDAGLRISAAASYGRNIVVNAETNSSGVSGNRAIEFFNSTGSGTLTGTVALEKTVGVNVTNSAATGVLSGVISGVGWADQDRCGHPDPLRGHGEQLLGPDHG
jgi:fibronectin-binding autotransporter adhesin